MCCVIVILLANHGLVHVVAPGPVPALAGGRTAAAALAPVLVHAQTPRAPVAGHAVVAVPAPAPGIELCRVSIFERWHQLTLQFALILHFK